MKTFVRSSLAYPFTATQRSIEALSVAGHLRVVTTSADEPPDAGYLPLVVENARPVEIPDGHHVAYAFSRAEDGTVHKRYVVLSDDDPTDARAPRTFSKLKCHLALREAGLWPQVRAWLEENDLWDAFVLAQDVAEDDPQFVAARSALQTHLALSDAEVESVLSMCEAAGAGR